MSKKKKRQYQSLKGFKDVLPEEQKFWDFVYQRSAATAMDYGYRKLDLPILEDARIYIKGTGANSDIVEKELYQFEDKGGNKVALRPEFTPGVLRSYMEHGMINQPQPVKLFSFGPVFRHDNPQSGRFRQFNQFNFEVIGSDLPEVDSQLITMVAGLYKSFGFEVTIEVNSIGCADCRHEYIKEFNKYLRKNSDKLCDVCKERIGKNSLRVLDCKEEACREATVDAPQIIDYLCEECRDHFVKVLENLDEVDITYSLNPRLVRGLDYYNRTTFEVFLNEESLTETTEADSKRFEEKKIALGGGGRYDGLMEILGGRPTPAIGMAGGVERVITVLRKLKFEVPDSTQADVFIAQLGEEAKKKGVKLFEDMRRQGVRVREAFSKSGLKAQMEVADRLKVKYTLILGQKEILDNTIIVRDMESGIQEIILFDQVTEEVKKRLSGSNGVRVYKEEIKEEKDTSADGEIEKEGKEIKKDNEEIEKLRNKETKLVLDNDGETNLPASEVLADKEKKEDNLLGLNQEKKEKVIVLKPQKEEEASGMDDKTTSEEKYRLEKMGSDELEDEADKILRQASAQESPQKKDD